MKDIVEARDLSFEQKESILGGNASDFFQMKNLPQPSAIKIARRTWEAPVDKAAAYGGR